MNARGQASVEVVAVIPLVVLVAAAAFHVLAAGAASEAAGSAAHAGAVAMLQDRDPLAAARRSLAGWPRRSIAISVARRRVSVTVRPRGLPVVTRRLTARAAARAGPAPPPASVSADPVRGGDGLAGRPERRR